MANVGASQGRDKVRSKALKNVGLEAVLLLDSQSLLRIFPKGSFGHYAGRVRAQLEIGAFGVACTEERNLYLDAGGTPLRGQCKAELANMQRSICRLSSQDADARIDNVARALLAYPDACQMQPCIAALLERCSQSTVAFHIVTVFRTIALEDWRKLNAAIAAGLRCVDTAAQQQDSSQPQDSQPQDTSQRHVDEPKPVAPVEAQRANESKSKLSLLESDIIPFQTEDAKERIDRNVALVRSWFYVQRAIAYVQCSVRSRKWRTIDSIAQSQSFHKRHQQALADYSRSLEVFGKRSGVPLWLWDVHARLAGLYELFGEPGEAHEHAVRYLEGVRTSKDPVWQVGGVSFPFASMVIIKDKQEKLLAASASDDHASVVQHVLGLRQLVSDVLKWQLQCGTWLFGPVIAGSQALMNFLASAVQCFDRVDPTVAVLQKKVTALSKLYQECLGDGMRFNATDVPRLRLFLARYSSSV